MKQKVGIYKITNQVNGKSYIGQSVNIYKRWNNHKSESYNKNAKTYDCKFYRAIRKYGIENFEFSILEECDSINLNEREIYWISYYNSYHDGYNETLGGNNGQRELDEKTKGIFYDLLYSSLLQKDIAAKWNVSRDTVDRINKGNMWHQETITYPIRQRQKPREKHCVICNKLISQTAKKYCVDCYIKQKGNHIPDKDTLLELIMQYPLTQIGRMYNVSSKSIEKWCKKHELPFRQKQILALKNTLQN